MVDPRFDRELVEPHLFGLELGLPAVVDERAHRRLRPARRAELAVEEQYAHRIVPVNKHVGLDADGIADDPLCREARGVDLGVNSLDHDAPSALLRFACIHRLFGVFLGAGRRRTAGGLLVELGRALRLTDRKMQEPVTSFFVSR
jgi:hypothetical protein